MADFATDFSDWWPVIYEGEQFVVEFPRGERIVFAFTGADGDSVYHMEPLAPRTRHCADGSARIRCADTPPER